MLSTINTPLNEPLKEMEHTTTTTNSCLPYYQKSPSIVVILQLYPRKS